MNQKSANTADPGRRLFADVVSGAAAGVAAALVTSLFQSAWTRLRLPPTTSKSAEPPTEALAANVFREMTGAEITGNGKVIGGEAVHY